MLPSVPSATEWDVLGKGDAKDIYHPLRISRPEFHGYF
jgi:hypothetical protein